MYRIMIVDDEPLFRDYLRMKMDWGDYGYEVCCEARNGKEALEEAEQHRPHLALIDINMPFMNGFELAEQLKIRFAEMTIVFVTGHNEFEYVQQAVRLGVHDYLLKPFNREELASMLERIQPKLPKLQESPEVEQTAPLGSDATIKQYPATAIQESILISLRLSDQDTLSEVKRAIQSLRSHDVNSEYVYTMLMGLVSIGLSFAGERGVALEHLLENMTGPSPDKYLRGCSTWDEIEAWLLNFFERIICLTESTRQTKSYKLYTDAKAYIEHHYTEEELSVEAVAAILFVDPSYLRRVFRKESGYSVLDHITHIRMKKAKDLIQKGNMKLSTIAYEVGYSDPNYFSKSFKKKFGMTPTEFEQLR
ncbi:response regulator [Paenibacillus sp. GCM10012306]|uniref:response regulator n=1 Tax=Paenibacillus sp. GCM10012306 TaxID=3317342 RepID=UPI00361DA28C